MPAAANLNSTKVAGTEAAPAAAPGVADLFAALVAAIGPIPEEGKAPAQVEGETEEAVASEEADADAAMDAAILLPLLEQQRAAVPANDVATAVSTGAAVAGATTPLPPGSPQFASARAEFQRMQAAVAQREVDVEQRRQAYVADMDAKGIYVPDSYRHARTDGTGYALESELNEWGEKGNWTIMARHNYGDAVKGMNADQIRGYVQSGEADRVVAAYNARVGPGAGGFGPEAISRTGMGGLQTVSAQSGASKPCPVSAPTLQSQAAQLVPQAIQGLAARASAPGRPGAGPTSIQAADAARQPIGAAPPPELLARPSVAAPAPASPAPEVRQEPALLDQLSAAQPSRESAAAAPLGTTPAAGPLPGAPASPAQNLGAAIAAQVLDLAKGGEWINEVARDIARSASTEGPLRFRLTPESLGELRVEITQTDRGAHVRLHVTSEAAQQALAEAQPKLVQEARAQGVRIAEAEISFTGGQSQGRDPSRQAPSDQPMRSFRSAPDHHIANGDRSEPARSGRTDLYA